MRILAIVAAALWLALGLPVIGQEIQYRQFDIPGARLTRPLGVNTSGQIVGLFRDANNVPHGFLLNLDGTYEPIDYPGATFTNANAINARGDIVGRWTDAGGRNHGYLRTSLGTFFQIDPPEPCVVTTQQTVVHGINDLGDLVGRCFDAAGKELGWLWSHDGTFYQFDDPTHQTTDVWMATNQRTIVGDYSDSSLVVHGFVWTAESGLVTLDFPNSQTGLRDMNERGEITGIYADQSGRFHGLLLRAGAFATIDYPGAANGGGTLVINNAGVMVGSFIDGDGQEHGFVAR